MEREQIERHDFAKVRDGYDPAAVEEHLRRVADAFAARPSLADYTSEQVRATLEAAEAGAARLSAEAAARAADVRAAADAVARDAAELVHELQARAGQLKARLAALDAATSGRTPPPGGDPHATAERELAAPDEAGARLVALNMALGGSSREETARYLREHFGALGDPAALLDDVYARAGR